MHAKGLEAHEHPAFCTGVQEWVKTRVARHKFLRGGESHRYAATLTELSLFPSGVVVVDVIPKR